MEETSFEFEHFFDLIVIGSGPAALSVVTRILESRPAALYTEEEHVHLHWLRRKENEKDGKEQEKRLTGYQIQGKVSKKEFKRPILETKKVNGTNEKSLVKQENKSNVCQCEGRMKILIIDKFGSWMGNWNRLFKIYQIPHLRSPLFFHPAPADLDALVAFAEERKGKENGNRLPDLIEIPGCVGKEISKHKLKKRRQFHRKGEENKIVNERDRKDYFTPSTNLFHDFIQQDCINRYGLHNDQKPWLQAKEFFEKQEQKNPIEFVHGEVIDLDWKTVHIKGWQRMKGFQVTLQGEYQVAAKAIVCAGGPGPSPRIPTYLSSSSAGWCHSTQLGLQGRTLPPAPLLKRMKENKTSCLVVIGGGLTSAQICDVCIRSGIEKVILLMRGYFKIKPFDFDLQWIGRYANLEKMRFWQEEDPQKRLDIILQARNGGSITPRYAKLMKKYEQQGKLEILTCTEVEQAQWTPKQHDSEIQDEGEWELDIVTTKKVKVKKNPKLMKTLDDQKEMEQEEMEEIQRTKRIVRPHFIISATGASPSFSQTPFLKRIANQFPIPEYGGLPWLTENLQYGSLPLFCTGAFSALQIGPGAFNLEGMRAAADRIAIRLQELAIGQDDQEETESSSKSSSKSFFTHFAFEQLPQEIEA